MRIQLISNFINTSDYFPEPNCRVGRGMGVQNQVFEEEKYQ